MSGARAARLVERGREAVAPLLALLAGPEGGVPGVAVLLAGSAATEFADHYSGIDFVLLVPDEAWEAVAARLCGGGSPQPGEVRALSLAGRRVKVSPWPVGEVGRRARQWDDAILYTLSTAQVLHDPDGLTGPLFALVRDVPPAVWEEKAALAYRQFRQRKASLAWALRRGQPFLCLDNLTQLLTAALSLCYYLEGRPPANRKWLFRGALRTAPGQALRPLLFDLFSSLGEIALLGGSFSLRRNRLYRLLSEIQAQLEAELARRGRSRAAPPEGCGACISSLTAP